MLSYNIRKNKPSVIRRIIGGIHEIGRPPTPPQHMGRRPMIVDERGVVTVPPNTTAPSMAIQYGNKAFYNGWINKIREEFPKGALVTLRMYAIIPDRLDPPPCFHVGELQEIRHLATWDTTYRQPRAVQITPVKEGAESQWVAPALIRKLTDHERYLVNLQYQKEQADESRGTPPNQAGAEGSANDSYSG
jgi:hypothetical protein